MLTTASHSHNMRIKCIHFYKKISYKFSIFKSNGRRPHNHNQTPKYTYINNLYIDITIK